MDRQIFRWYVLMIISQVVRHQYRTNFIGCTEKCLFKECYLNLNFCFENVKYHVPKRYRVMADLGKYLESCFLTIK